MEESRDRGDQAGLYISPVCPVCVAVVCFDILAPSTCQKECMRGAMVLGISAIPQQLEQIEWVSPGVGGNIKPSPVS